MGHLSTEILLIIICSVVIVSYLFSILSKYIKVPSVLLLLTLGIVLRAVSNREEWGIVIPEKITEFSGVVGLVMIVLEAGLDLKLSRDKVKMIRDSFFAALSILVISAAGIAATLHWWLGESLVKCIVYAIPLSIMSSSIVIPSLHHLAENKKKFLVYEASFSDMLGILFFNYFTGKEILSGAAFGHFTLNIILAVVFSLLFSIVLFLILAKSTMNVKFFLVFALLIILYEGGKMLQLPSLLIILIFGMLMRNWELISVKLRRIRYLFRHNDVEDTTRFLHSITAESSFLIRTFFFVLFGFSIDVQVLLQSKVALIGSAIVFILLIARYLYLRFFLKESVYPEVFFIPRGLITILLFYKIPAALQLQSFDDGILFFIILLTGIIMMLGMIFYRKKQSDIVEEVI